jgi:hypothetical protein
VYYCRDGRWEGPYRVETVNSETTPIKVTLCWEDGRRAMGGQEVPEEDVELAD